MPDLSDNGLDAEFAVVRWLHTDTPYPILIYAELNKDRYEVRKIEAFLDGHMQTAPPDDEAGGTGLAWEPWPSLEEIGADSQFEPKVITKEEFERVWTRAISGQKYNL